MSEGLHQEDKINDCICENEVDASGMTWFGFKIDPMCPLHGLTLKDEFRRTY